MPYKAKRPIRHMMAVTMVNTATTRASDPVSYTHLRIRYILHVKDSFFPGKLWQDRAYPDHLVLQVLVLSQHNLHIAVGQGDLIAAVKLYVIWDYVIFLENGGKRHCSSQNRTSLDWKLLPLDHMAYLDPVKKRNQLVPVSYTHLEHRLQPSQQASFC